MASSTLEGVAFQTARPVFGMDTYADSNLISSISLVCPGIERKHLRNARPVALLPAGSSSTPVSRPAPPSMITHFLSLSLALSAPAVAQACEAPQPAIPTSTAPPNPEEL